jgi:hypothetical protein
MVPAVAVHAMTALAEDGTFIVSNTHLRAAFDGKTGLLVRLALISDADGTDNSITLRESLFTYSSR